MTDRSLFPDYPDAPGDAPRRDPCSEHAAPSPNAVPDRLWALVHTLAHGRVPFSVTGLEAVAVCTNRQADIAIRAAVTRDWLHRVHPEPYERHPTPLWVGCLPRRR